MLVWMPRTSYSPSARAIRAIAGCVILRFALFLPVVAGRIRRGRRIVIPFLMIPAVHDAEQGGDEEQRGNGGEGQSADYRAPQRRILLAP